MKMEDRKLFKIYIGIDPGKDGFISFYIKDTDMWEFFPMPVIGSGKKEYDINSIVEIFKYFSEYKAIVGIENVNALKQAGSTSNFQFGRGVGILLGVVSSFKYPFEMVHSTKWQKLAHKGISIMTKPDGGKDTKFMSILAAKRLYPTLDLTKSERSKKPHEGKVDSILITHYLINNF
jgi:hypothetical protein